MNPRYLAILIILIALGGGVVFFLSNREAIPLPPENTEGVCTLDAKLCPDGSSVGRVPPSCEFAACPTAVSTSTTELTEDPLVQTTTVRYSTDGFEPRSVTIKKGTAVRFVNDSDRDMWVGSALHPTHEVYPQKSDTDCLGSSFDQCKAEPKGSVFEFTFDYAGSWNYHNHVRANHFGTIIVEE